MFLDEDAKWDLKDDRPVFNSIMPIVNLNGSDLFLISTPKGPMKMHYKIWKNPKDFIKVEMTIERTIGNLYDQETVDDMIKNCHEDPNQEYFGKFTISEASIFGTISDDDRLDLEEWHIDTTGYDSEEEWIKSRLE